MVCDVNLFLIFFAVFFSSSVAVATMTKELNLTVRMLVDPPRHQGIGFQVDMIGRDNVNLQWDDSLKTFNPIQLKYRAISNGRLEMQYRIIINALYLSCSTESGPVVFDDFSVSEFPPFLWGTERTGYSEIKNIGRSWVGLMDYTSWTPTFGDNSAIGEGVFDIKFPDLSTVYKAGGGKCVGGITIGITIRDL